MCGKPTPSRFALTSPTRARGAGGDRISVHARQGGQRNTPAPGAQRFWQDRAQSRGIRRGHAASGGGRVEVSGLDGCFPCSSRENRHSRWTLRRPQATPATERAASIVSLARFACDAFGRHYSVDRPLRGPVKAWHLPAAGDPMGRKPRAHENHRESQRRSQTEGFVQNETPRSAATAGFT